MADAYLRWRYPDDLRPSDLPTKSGGSGGTQDPPLPQQSSIVNNDPPLPEAPGLIHDSLSTDTPSPSTPTEVEITVIDIYSLSTSVKYSCIEDQTTATTLAGLGFIGNAPFRPSVAVSIKTLELYRILRRRKPSFSVEGFVKVISDLYMVCMAFVDPLPILNLYISRSHIVPNTVTCFRMRLMLIWKSSELLTNVSRRCSATTVPTGVC
jgi:hypothetical protein